MAKRQNLGRGLDALLGGSFSPTLMENNRDTELRDLPLDLIERGRYQPRIDMDTERLQELAASIRAQGVVQPIVVRPIQQGMRYELIAGERRWRAAQLAGLAEIPAQVRDVPDEAVLAISLIENVQREDLNPIEEANALRRFIDDFGMTHETAAHAVGRSRTAVSNLLRLLELNDEVKELVQGGLLEMGHARALLGLPPEQQSEAAHQVMAKGLSARETERLVAKLKSDSAHPKSARQPQDPDVRRLQNELEERLGAKVRIDHQATGKGSLVIRYGSLEELDGILARIR
jgi:ParB family chromosome partitioning protein